MMLQCTTSRLPRNPTIGTHRPRQTRSLARQPHQSPPQSTPLHRAADAGVAQTRRGGRGRVSGPPAGRVADPAPDSMGRRLTTSLRPPIPITRQAELVSATMAQTQAADLTSPNSLPSSEHYCRRREWQRIQAMVTGAVQLTIGRSSKHPMATT
jgi:hypothetical protein